MIDIIICEDDKYYREKVEETIKDEVNTLNLDLEVALSTSDPNEVINYITNNLNKTFIYFLDVELKSDMNGIELAKVIRKYDARGYIVFITSHTELSNLTFKYKVQALDYISKFDTNTFKNSISECLVESYNDYKNNYIEEKDFIEINFGNRITKFSYNEILFFETTNTDHKLRLHTKTGYFEFYGKIKDLETDSPSFFSKTHRSYFVNTKNIKSINKDTNTITMINGEVCYASAKYLRGLKKNG